ncbi:sensor histidine kinase [Zunongwangia pacifica]|uniref:Histidine kinase n=1 Tax=Zunongwangia pacifica TaxID=2911062 RepID=A0A9X2CPP8_9FLAO|nr:histidine kinase [Zunongwangia pacifica]MCL6220379.1 histidine kinase [Zunongwangia pacifica]
MRLTSFEKFFLFYGCLFIAIALNMHRLLNLLVPGVQALGIPWAFNLPELLYQTFLHFGFCYVLARFNLLQLTRYSNWSHRKRLSLILSNLFLFLVFIYFAELSQQQLFHNTGDLFLYRAGYLFRYIVGAGLVTILVSMLVLYRQQRLKEEEHERLERAYATAQLENLKAQMNPHFLFNALSNLSALMTESSSKAQQYLANLSQILRYGISGKQGQLVPVEQELQLLKAHLELLKIKYAANLQAKVCLDLALGKHLPFMALPPLLENVLKHNQVSEQHQMKIKITSDGENIYFENNLTLPPVKITSTGIGLANLQERYQLLTNKSLEIQKSLTYFRVVLPLI